MIALISPAVDWGEMADDNNYLRSAASTQNVGRNVAMVIDHMVTKRKARLEDIHIIGHSLGAHIAGYAGMYSKSGKGKKVGRITGLGETVNLSSFRKNQLKYFRPSLSRFSRRRKDLPELGSIRWRVC